MISEEEFLNACRFGRLGIVRLYIAEGGDVNVSDEDGNTALIWTAHHGYNSIGEMAAAQYDFPACLRELINAGTEENNSNDEDIPEQISAVKDNQAECALMLLAAGVNVNARNNAGRTALMYALLNNRHTVAQICVESGADIYAKDNNGKDAINYCNYKSVKDRLIRAQRHIKTAVDCADNPVVIQGFDPEL